MLSCEHVRFGAFGATTRRTPAFTSVLLVLIAALAAIFVPAHAARGQGCTAGWLPGQGAPGIRGDGDRVNAIVVLPNGEIIVGGYFSTAGSVAASNIARYNPSTGAWSAMGSGTDSEVRALAILASGDVIVGGYFSTAGGVAASRIARYSPMTGAWAPMGLGPEGSVDALAVLPSGEVLAGGSFTMAGGGAANNIARFNPTTGVWAALGSGVSGGAFPEVLALAVLPGGDVIVGGSFATAGGVVANSIARYNPSTNTWSALGSGTNSIVYALAVLPGGDVIVGGFFTTAGGVTANRIARLNPTTGSWSAMGSGVAWDNYYTAPSVRALAVLPGGDVMVGGDFGSAGGIETSGTAIYTPATGAWRAAGYFSYAYQPGSVRALAALPGGDVIVGGNFFFVGNFDFGLTSIARYSPATGEVSALGLGLNGPVNAMVVLPGGDVLVGGSFNIVGGVPTRSLARYNPTTGAWSALAAGPYGRVNALAVLPGGDVLVGGSFESVGDLSTTNIARYNPATGVWSALGSGVGYFGFTERVDSLVVLPGGDVIVGGQFSVVGDIAANNIARYNPTTGVWSALGSGVSLAQAPDYVVVSALAVLPGGDIVVGGIFSAAGGVAANYIARYNPTTGVWAALGSGTSDAVSALIVLPSGDVLVGGYFQNAGGVLVFNIARYRPSTGAWSALGGGTGGALVTAFALSPGGDVIVGGDFSLAGGVYANRIARFNPATGAWSPVGSGVGTQYGLYEPVNALAVLPGGDIVAGGDFLTAGAGVSAYFARYSFAAPASITQQPSSQRTCPAGSSTVSVTAAGSGPLTYQWQFANPAGAWINLVDGSNTYSGSRVLNASGSHTRALTCGTSGWGSGGATGVQLRCIVSNACGSVTSNPATLTIINPADIANTDGDPGFDGALDNGDFTAFFMAFFLDAGDPARLIADIANTDGEIPSDGAVDNGDFTYFFVAFFGGCP